MKIDYVKLFCGNCPTEDQWKTLEFSEVRVTLDLKTNKYEFTASCPHCGEQIYNSRDAF